MASKKAFNVSTVSEPVTFTIDDDEFDAIPANRLPAGALAKYFTAINNNSIFDAQDLFFQAVLTEASYKLFSDRLNSAEKPIPFTVLTDVASWLLGEVYLQGEATAESKSS
jgi:hypothetical protein